MVIELEGGTLLTIDISGQSGNVLVGYGYITNPNGHPRFQVVFVIILFDDDGNVANYDYWNEEEIDLTPTKDDVEAMIGDMLDVVGDENDQDLANALDTLKDRIHDLGDQNKWEMLGKGILYGAIIGGISVPIVGIPLGIGFGAVTGFFMAAFTACENEKWNDWCYFLGELLNDAQIPKPT
jgi:hypothetical protein